MSVKCEKSCQNKDGVTSTLTKLKLDEYKVRVKVLWEMKKALNKCSSLSQPSNWRSQSWLQVSGSGLWVSGFRWVRVNRRLVPLADRIWTFMLSQTSSKEKLRLCGNDHSLNGGNRSKWNTEVEYPWSRRKRQGRLLGLQCGYDNICRKGRIRIETLWLSLRRVDGSGEKKPTYWLKNHWTLWIRDIS